MNPFIWCSIDFENFCKLIQNYNNLNFNNIDCELINNNSGICKQNSLTPKIIIDNKVEVCYFHYIQNEKYLIPTKKDGYTQCKDIIHYTLDCYKRRISKMEERPIFIWDVTKCKWYNKKQENPIDILKTFSKDYTIIVYSSKVLTDIDNTLILLNKANDDFEVNQSASNIYKMYLNKLL